MSLERAQEQLETNINCWLKTGRHVQVATWRDTIGVNQSNFHSK